MKICILGAGTYGSYVVNSLQEKYPQAQITVFDVGNQKVVNEKEIGFLSFLKKGMYKGLSDGRYFGFGGASHKWGGQLLTYTENDFSSPDQFMKDIIELDKKHKNKCLAKFNIKNEYPEKHLSDRLFTKTGVWLSMLHRNFFHWFHVNKRKNVTVLSHCRVVKLESNDKKHIEAVVYLENGVEKKAVFDYYFLTSGAFESSRILLSSELHSENKIYFSDHLSQKVFKIKDSTKIGKEDFVFRMRGTSLITKRMIGETNNCSFYIHPVFNLKFPFFEMVKDILFYHRFSIKKIGTYLATIIKDIPHVIGFIWSVIVLKKMYVMNNEWYLYIDIENPSKDSYITLSQEKDKFGIAGLNVYYSIGDSASTVFMKAKNIALKYLKENNTKFEVLTDNINIETCEDIYHPYGMLPFNSLNDYYTHWSNMLVVSTGCLSRSGGINPTASLFPVIDDFIFNHMDRLK